MKNRDDHRLIKSHVMTKMNDEEKVELLKHLIKDHKLSNEDIMRIADKAGIDIEEILEEEFEEEERLPYARRQERFENVRGNRRKLWSWEWHVGGGNLGGLGEGELPGCEVVNSTDATLCEQCNAESQLVEGVCQCTFDHTIVQLNQ